MTLRVAAVCDDRNDIEALAPSAPDLPGAALFESPKIVLCYDHEKDVEGGPRECLKAQKACKTSQFIIIARH